MVQIALDFDLAENIILLSFYQIFSGNDFETGYEFCLYLLYKIDCAEKSFINLFNIFKCYYFTQSIGIVHKKILIFRASLIFNILLPAC